MKRLVFFTDTFCLRYLHPFPISSTGGTQYCFLVFGGADIKFGCCSTCKVEVNDHLLHKLVSVSRLDTGIDFLWNSTSFVHRTW